MSPEGTPARKISLVREPGTSGPYTIYVAIPPDAPPLAAGTIGGRNGIELDNDAVYELTVKRYYRKDLEVDLLAFNNLPPNRDQGEYTVDDVTS